MQRAVVVAIAQRGHKQRSIGVDLVQTVQTVCKGEQVGWSSFASAGASQYSTTVQSTAK